MTQPPRPQGKRRAACDRLLVRLETLMIRIASNRLVSHLVQRACGQAMLEPRPFFRFDGRVKLMLQQDCEGCEVARVEAAAALDKGEILITIPEQLQFHPRSACVNYWKSQAIESLIPGHVKRSAEALASAVSTAFGPLTSPLMDVRNVGHLSLIALVSLLLSDAIPSESFILSAWRVYAQTMPQEPVELPSLAPLDDVLLAKALRGTSIEAMVRSDQEALARMAEDKDGIFKKYGTSFAAFRHAISVVSSRMFSGIGLIPVIDQVNGTFIASEANVELRQPSPGLPCFALQAIKNIPAGEEIILKYGDLSTAMFLYKYGWVPGGPSGTGAARGPHDGLPLPLGALDHNLSALQREVLSQRLRIDRTDAREVKAVIDWTPPLRLPAKLPGHWKKLPAVVRQACVVANISDEALLRRMLEPGSPVLGSQVSAGSAARTLLSLVQAAEEQLGEAAQEAFSDDGNGDDGPGARDAQPAHLTSIQAMARRMQAGELALAREYQSHIPSRIVAL